MLVIVWHLDIFWYILAKFQCVDNILNRSERNMRTGCDNKEQYDATYNSIKEQKTNHGLHFLRKNIIGNVYCDIKVSI